MRDRREHRERRENHHNLYSLHILFMASLCCSLFWNIDGKYGFIYPKKPTGDCSFTTSYWASADVHHTSFFLREKLINTINLLQNFYLNRKDQENLIIFRPLICHCTKPLPQPRFHRILKQFVHVWESAGCQLLWREHKKTRKKLS